MVRGAAAPQCVGLHIKPRVPKLFGRTVRLIAGLDHSHPAARDRRSFHMWAAASTSEEQLVAESCDAEQTGRDIQTTYPLSEDDIHSYRDKGFVRLPNVFSASTLNHYRPTMSLEVAKADKTPLEDDSDYQKAFTQVLFLTS